MKYSEKNSSLARINTFLDSVDAGDYVIHGNLEAFSCKLAGLDKKLSRSLDQEVQLGSSPLELSRSPVGPLSESASRKTLIYLILTLNQAFPDYDFSLLRAHHFRREAGVGAVEAAVDSHLLEASKAWESTPGCGPPGGEPFLDTLWAELDAAIDLGAAEVFSYRPDAAGGGDPFGDRGCVWSFNFFFYNRSRRLIVFFACRGLTRTAARHSSGREESASLCVRAPSLPWPPVVEFLDGSLERKVYNSDDDEGDSAAKDWASSMDV